MTGRRRDAVTRVLASDICDECREVGGERKERSNEVRDAALEDVAVQG